MSTSLTAQRTRKSTASAAARSLVRLVRHRLLPPQRRRTSRRATLDRAGGGTREPLLGGVLPHDHLRNKYHHSGIPCDLPFQPSSRYRSTGYSPVLTETYFRTCFTGHPDSAAPRTILELLHENGGLALSPALDAHELPGGVGRAGLPVLCGGPAGGEKRRSTDRREFLMVF